jgi:hypothetical protein
MTNEKRATAGKAAAARRRIVDVAAERRAELRDERRTRRPIERRERPPLTATLGERASLRGVR